jgi:peroxiredoxin
MISRGDLDANREKAAEHRLTFPVVLQRHWDTSRDYGMFATPIAYLIDEDGVIAADVAVGLEPIISLASTAAGKEVAAT